MPHISNKQNDIEGEISNKAQSTAKLDVYLTALFQKAILICVFLYSLLFAFVITINNESVTRIAGFLYIFITIAASVLILLCARKVFNTGMAVLFAILTCIPGLGFCVLLIVSDRATTILKENGFHVSLLGAKLSELKKYKKNHYESD